MDPQQHDIALGFFGLAVQKTEDLTAWVLRNWQILAMLAAVVAASTQLADDVRETQAMQTADSVRITALEIGYGSFDAKLDAIKDVVAEIRADQRAGIGKVGVYK